MEKNCQINTILLCAAFFGCAGDRPETAEGKGFSPAEAQATAVSSAEVGAVAEALAAAGCAPSASELEETVRSSHGSQIAFVDAVACRDGARSVLVAVVDDLGVRTAFGLSVKLSARSGAPQIHGYTFVAGSVIVEGMPEFLRRHIVEPAVAARTAPSPLTLPDATGGRLATHDGENTPEVNPWCIECIATYIDNNNTALAICAADPTFEGNDIICPLFIEYLQEADLDAETLVAVDTAYEHCHDFDLSPHPEAWPSNMTPACNVNRCSADGTCDMWDDCAGDLCPVACMEGRVGSEDDAVLDLCCGVGDDEASCGGALVPL